MTTAGHGPAPAEGGRRALEHVAVLAGGLSYERSVSLLSGSRVAEALRSQGLSVVEIEPDAHLLDRLRDAAPDAVVVALHGQEGEDGSVRAVLDLLGTPYAGSDAAASRSAWDKPVAKHRLRAAGLATPEWVALPHATFREYGADRILDRLEARLGLPLVVKPAQGGSALGVSRVERREDLPSAMVTCFGYGDVALVEHFVDGVEVAVSVVERDGVPVALPAVEVVTPPGAYDFAARYNPGGAEFFCPARVDDAVADAAAAAAVLAHRTLGLRDLSRTDAVVDADGVVQVLEVNVSPGMTGTSLLPRSVAVAGLDLGAVVADLLRASLQR